MVIEMGIINKMIDTLMGETMSEPEFIKPVTVDDNKQVIHSINKRLREDDDDDDNAKMKKAKKIKRNK